MVCYYHRKYKNAIYRSFFHIHIHVCNTHLRTRQSVQNSVKVYIVPELKYRVKISSQTQPDASPSVGLRLVGLLPCAVWSPKVPKPTIGGQVRATPYTTSTATIRSAGVVADPSTSTQHSNIHRLFATAQNINETPSTSCRCTNNTHTSTQVTTEQTTTTGTITSITPINQHTINQRSLRSIPSARVAPTNPMLLLPFAAMPGFVPIQSQFPANAPNGECIQGKISQIFDKQLQYYYWACALGIEIEHTF